jgi:glycosyltransferase involved in cell wall biosynthesis
VVGATIPPVIGGLEVYTYELARQLSRRNHRVFLLGYRHYREKIFSAHEISEGVEIFRLPSHPRTLLGNKLFYFQKATGQLGRIHQKTPLDLIHANTVIPAGLAGALFKRKHPRVPLVITSHGYEVLVRPKNLLFKIISRFVFRQAGWVIGVSQEVAAASVGAGAPAEIVANWANPVDTTRFHPGGDRNKIRHLLGIKPEEVVILSLRRLHPKTGVQYLIASAPQIVSKIKQVKFLIIGEGELKETLLKKVRSCGLESYFIFTGAIPNEVVPEYIAAADLAVFPSLVEATSIACLEVMAMGVPVVASDVGGLPEIIEDGYNGLLVPFPKKKSDYLDSGLSREVVENLSGAIIKLASRGNLRNIFGKNGAKKVSQYFSWEYYLEKLLKVYDGLINAVNPKI